MPLPFTSGKEIPNIEHAYIITRSLQNNAKKGRRVLCGDLGFVERKISFLRWVGNSLSSEKPILAIRSLL